MLVKVSVKNSTSTYAHNSVQMVGYGFTENASQKRKKQKIRRIVFYVSFNICKTLVKCAKKIISYKIWNSYSIAEFYMDWVFLCMICISLSEEIKFLDKCFMNTFEVNENIIVRYQKVKDTLIIWMFFFF